MLLRNPLFIGILFFALNATGYAENGRDVAEAICQKHGISSEILKCQESLSKVRYFERVAAEYCASLSTQGDRVHCLMVIQNKEYSNLLVATCKKEGFSSRILECLGRVGTKVQAALLEPKEEILRAMQYIDQGKYSGAKEILGALLTQY